MATGLKPVTSPNTDGSVYLVAGSFADAATASGDGWSMARSGTGVYTVTLSTGTATILSVVSSIAYADNTALRVGMDSATTGQGITTVPSATAGTVVFACFNDVSYETGDSAAAVLGSGSTLHFIIAASHAGK